MCILYVTNAIDEARLNKNEIFVMKHGSILLAAVIRHFVFLQSFVLCDKSSSCMINPTTFLASFKGTNNVTDLPSRTNAMTLVLLVIYKCPQMSVYI